MDSESASSGTPPVRGATDPERPAAAATNRTRDTNVSGWDAMDLDSLAILGTAPCWMTTSERLLLYAIAFASRPRRYLEIGTFRGGSAAIVGAAMDASRNPGRMVCIDPEPQVEPAVWERIAHRATLIAGPSPDVLDEAMRSAGGRFDLALVDGDHTGSGARRDLEGLLGRLEPGAHVLCHDGHFPEVARAIEEFRRAHAPGIDDAGLLTMDVSWAGEGAERTGPWGGLHLLRFR